MSTKITCPKCKASIEVNPAQLMRAIPSKARSEASRRNGAKHKAKGGRPRKSPGKEKG